MKVSVLIASRDRPGALRRCLASVARQRYGDLEVLVLDDASSTPLDAEALRRETPGLALRCLRSDQRRGPIDSRNVLMKHARGDVFVVLDDDAFLHQENGIEQAVAAFDQYPDAGILAFKLIERVQGQERLLLPYRRRRLKKQPHLAEQVNRVAHYLAGSHALRRTVIERCGYFQDGLCYGHEELDLSYRTLNAGFTILYLPTVVAFHVPETQAARWNAWKLYYSMRNRLWVASKYLPRRYLPSHFAFWILFYGFHGLKNGFFRSYWNGLKDGLTTISHQERHPIADTTQAYLKAHGGRLWF